jgi:GT2 family glycosyltransferase
MVGRTTVVVATRDRGESLAESLAHHEVPVILVDNGSRDGTPDLVRARFPEIRLVELPENRGAPARNLGVELAGTPFVAFADDDSWWAPGALALAEAIFDQYPRLGLVAGSVLVGADERLDPTSALMSRSPLGRAADLPGPSVLGFMACGAIVRREAFLAAGGFDDVVFFLGEEERLALDLSAAGWGLSYVAEVVAHHHPGGGGRDPAARRRLQIRNALLTSVMRRPWPVVGGQAWRALRGSADGRRALLAALRRAPAALRARKRLPPTLEQLRKMLDQDSVL